MLYLIGLIFTSVSYGALHGTEYGFLVFGIGLMLAGTVTTFLADQENFVNQILGGGRK